MSYSLTPSNGSGRGLENETEKGQIATALEFSTGVLERCTQDMQNVFSDLTSFTHDHFDWTALRFRS